MYMKQADYSREELEAQKACHFEERPIFSIVVPLYNTPIPFLTDMIDSVRNQTYGGWQLCLADGSDSDHQEVREICLDYAEKDRRICYRKQDANLGISGNTNAAIDMAEGDYIALLDHDDILHPSALYEVTEVICRREADLVYTDEAVFESPDIRNILSVHYKPDFAPDNLRACNYLSRFVVFRSALLRQTGGFLSRYDSCRDHDMMLRIAAVTDRIAHVPKVLYYRRSYPRSGDTETRASADAAGRNAVEESLRRANLPGRVENTACPGIYRAVYELREQALVSVIIPNCDHTKELDRCLSSIEEKSSYLNREILIVENNSRDSATFTYYEQAQNRWPDVKVIRREGAFNYPAVNNYAVREYAAGKYILLLNNDTEIITPDWIEQMLMYAQRPDVGAVGAMLLYPDGTVQHAGIILGMEGVAGHCFIQSPGSASGYHGRLQYAQDLSAVTGACMMVRRDVWEKVGGLDETFSVSYNDVDLCMRMRKKGYLIVWTPEAKLYHLESASRGYDDTPEKMARMKREYAMFKTRWSAELDAGDPYYNPNLSLYRYDFALGWRFYEKKWKRDMRKWKLP